MNGLGLVALRLSLAAVFIAHGTHKLFGLFAGPSMGAGGLDATAQAFAAAGLNPSFPLAVAVGVIETLGGLLIAIGWMTRIAASLLILISTLMVWKFYWAAGFFLNWAGASDRGQGIELHVLLIGALLCQALTGPGEWSIDGNREKSAAQRAAGKARLRGKV